MNIFSFKHIHFTGIKGVGMTALAVALSNLGIKVTGSDVEEVFVTDETLKENNISWEMGFSDSLQPKPDLVITTGAHGGLNNHEVVKAKNTGIPVLTLSQAQAEFARGKEQIVVVGVGGKTTTSAIITTILKDAQKHPSYLIGAAKVRWLPAPGKYDRQGNYFVTEGDEFAISPGINNNPRFSLLSPKILVVTNIEHDHPDIYPTFQDTIKAFSNFAQKVPKNGLVLVASNNKNNLKILNKVKAKVQTYGFSKGSDWHVTNASFQEEETSFKLNDITLSIKIPGEFNILNSTAALAAVNFLGVDIKTAVKALKSFGGVRRRAEKMGERNGVLFYDDYAHHPTEIQATLKAFRSWYPQRRIVAIFQPHTYSRTKALLSDFAKSFSHADKVAIVDIYASRETDTQGVTSEILANEAKKYHKDVKYVGSLEKGLEFIQDQTQEGDVVITMGAGNISHIYKKLL